jgi:hypothetical protein
MAIRARQRARALVLAGGATLATSRWAAAQEAVGHELPGTIGMHAGSQGDAGVYLVDRFADYRTNNLIDRHGNSLPVGLELRALSDVVGVGFAYEIKPIRTYVGASFSIPMAHVRATLQIPEASVDQFGLGDLSVQPLRLGWRTRFFDVVTGYAFYAPTAPFEPGGVGRLGSGQWTHEVSLGGTVRFDPARTWTLSALASIEFPQHKLDEDITRGDILQIQGGIGKAIRPFFEAGLAGYALWQVTQDRGADLPQVLRGQHDRSYGLGPEMTVAIAPIRTRVTVRYEHEFSVRSRPEGQIVVLEIAVAVCGPEFCVGERSPH